MSRARVSATEVKQIIVTTVDDAIIESNFIDTANLYVNSHLTGCVTNTPAILKKIEMYIAAHLLAVSEEGGTLKYKKLGDASEAYDVDHLGDGLNSTRYGQMAVMLETCGILADVGSPRKEALFRVV